MSRDPGQPLHVAAAVLRDRAGRILLSRRHDHLHQGGLWEFPGGKLEPGESVVSGLSRELREELGIEVLDSRPFLCIDHDYPDLTVRLDVHEVLAWRGTPQPLEGQALRWADAELLDPAEFPAADVPVLTALRLPSSYVISESPGNVEEFMETLETCITRGERLFQLRATGMAEESLGRLAVTAAARCARAGARLLVNAMPEQARGWGAHGVHLTADRLMRLRSRPLSETFLIAASCHDAKELEHAQAIGVDFVVLSPLRVTRSHPHAKPLGWARFASLAAGVDLPVYALGGVSPGDLDAVRRAHGFGVAGIGAFWPRRPA